MLNPKKFISAYKHGIMELHDHIPASHVIPTM